MGANRKDDQDRAVLILGSGFGALKVAEDLCQSGIPVVWVTRAPHFLEVAGGAERFKEWPEDLNFQFRPLYLRVTRHPLVRAFTHARVESVEWGTDGFRVQVEQDPMYIDYDLCTGCGKCMEVCPLQDSNHPPLTRTPPYCPSRALEMDKRKLSLCRTSCPLGVNAQAYLALTAAGRFDEALAVVREANPLPGICGRICHHPCEASCRRSELDDPVAIRDIKRFLADWEVEQAQKPGPTAAEHSRRSEMVAVIGSGPSGLTAAHHLNREGFQVTVFEAMPQAGGMLRAGINAFRLPRSVLDREIQAITDGGVKLKTNARVGSLDDLFEQGYQAVVLCTGTHGDLKLKVPGEELPGVIHCVRFLSRLNLGGEGKAGARTLVIGGGNSAMDAARTALRLGAQEVTVAAIETAAQLPAHPREVKEAQEEGIDFRLGLAPIAIEPEGEARRVVFRPAHWEASEAGPPRLVFDSEDTVSLLADTVIVAVGQRPHLDEYGLAECVECGPGGRITVNERMEASRPGVFAAGDVVTGPSTVIGSMAAGRKAAGQVMAFLTHKPSPFTDLTPDARGVGDYVAIAEDVPKKRRQELAQRQPKARVRDFEEVDIGFTAEQAMAEAERCLQCGSCCECMVCESACAEIGALDHYRQARRFEFESPAVIVANEAETPDDFEYGEGVHRLTQIEQTNDLVDVLVSGSWAAGLAMTESLPLRRLTAPAVADRLRKDDEPRLGVFLCSCNGTMAPAAVMDRLRDLAATVPGIAYSERINSCCHPAGADRIALAVAAHDLNRVIMASCVCCPLEFHCISCNDQRSRAKLHLFNRLGLEASMFEMYNLRDQLHALSGSSEDQLFETARDLLRMAYIRARFMGPLSQGHTEMGKRILVLGGSEIGETAAMNLDLQGFKVRLVHRCRLKDQPAPPSSGRIDRSFGKSIDHVAEATIEEIRGSMGDFTVLAREAGARRRWRADMICLTDDSVLPLAIQEDMVGLRKVYRYNFAFFHTPQGGLYRVLPRTLERVSPSQAGAALAAQVATAAAEAWLKDHELAPKVDPDRCRGCGRCLEICPFDAIKLEANESGFYTARVIHHNCVGCGGCVGRCPVTAMDMPYFSNQLLKEMVSGVLGGER